jgi:hypothetical protein
MKMLANHIKKTIEEQVLTHPEVNPETEKELRISAAKLLARLQNSSEINSCLTCRHAGFQFVVHETKSGQGPDGQPRPGGREFGAQLGGCGRFLNIEAVVENGLHVPFYCSFVEPNAAGSAADPARELGNFFGGGFEQVVAEKQTSRDRQK